MNHEDIVLEDGTVINEKKVVLIINRITALEKENIETRRYEDIEMAKKIRKIIEEEVGCF